MAATTKMARRMIDIGANLTDPMFSGFYNMSKHHDNDLAAVLQRSKQSGVEKIIITGGSLTESHEALKIAMLDNNLYSTVGCHPTRCTEFEAYDSPEMYLNDLEKLITANRNKVVALGELGLDYDRLYHCPKEVQKKYFDMQLQINKKAQLPLFLHNRNSSEDFFQIMEKNKDCYTGSGGVVHSFDGSFDDVSKILNLNLHIGINGCSFKKSENLSVIKTIPVDRLLIETDCPWCGIKQTHSSFEFVKTHFQSSKKEKYKPDHQVKGRNEPSNLIQVLEVLAALKEMDIDELSEIVYNNTVKLFFK